MMVKGEPNASIYELTDYLNPRGCTLAVTLEIGDATAGGLALDVGMITHSHKVSTRGHEHSYKVKGGTAVTKNVLKFVILNLIY